MMLENGYMEFSKQSRNHILSQNEISNNFLFSNNNQKEENQEEMI